MTMDTLCINANGIGYRQLNEQVREALARGTTHFEIDNVCGQRYIAAAATGDAVSFRLCGVPGQDMGAFLAGPFIRVEGNAQDGVGNTMDAGTIVINGLAGDVLGYAMRGGRIFVRGDVGYRVGIHMKAYKEKCPIIVVGGKAGDFLGEYMAGGAIIVLGMYSGNPNAPLAGRSLGTGMHGGVIYVRGTIDPYQLGPGLIAESADENDLAFLAKHLDDFAKEFDVDAKEIRAEGFCRIKPFSHRPYGNLYVPT
ncbi:hypothetical protein [Desulfovibrio inopinatus]|uniref:GltB/FmdC/FwdC-like GXGXG domain-containing protein n=1 Tax=Desulfovibrio inopinatus TaxID=102109 RepID=UPI000426197B|nr:hypothetical protein [Desulfovibrio inopinatus]